MASPSIAHWYQRQVDFPLLQFEAVAEAAVEQGRPTSLDEQRPFEAGLDPCVL